MNFHFYGTDKTYIQTLEGIDEERKNPLTEELYYVPVANVVIKEITIILDSLVY